MDTLDSVPTMPGSVGSIQEYLNGVKFPLKKDDFVDALAQNGAPEAVLERARSAGADRFESAQDALAKLQGMA